MSKTNGLSQPFEGFWSPNYTQVPDQLFDELLPDLSGAELKVLLYIMRRTFGFKKDQDDISLSQICNGLTTHDGRVLDRGTGLSQSTVQVALKSLVAKNIVTATKRVSRERGNEATTYALNLRGPFTENRQRGVPKIGEALHRKSVRQETVIQETDVSPSRFERSHDELAQTNDAGSGEGDHPVVARTHHEAPTSHAQEETEEQGSGTQYVPLGELLRLRTHVAASIGAGKTAAASTPTTPESRAPLPAPKKLGRPVGNAEEREQLRAYLSDFSKELGDEAPLASTITRTLKIFTAANVPPARWGDYLYQARAICQERTSQITKQASGPTSVRRKNKMPYFLATLEQQVGLRPLPSGQSGQPVHPR